MKECCYNFVSKLSPRNPKLGKLSEIHKCNECDKKIKVDFECNVALGGKLQCSAIAANYTGN